MMFFCFATSIAIAAPHVVEIDFEDVDVTATAPRPEISLIQQYTPDLCADIDPTSDEWIECVSNIDYADIEKICNSLGADTRQFVDALKRRHVDVLIGKEDDAIHWEGCFYNSAQGAVVENLDFTFANNTWIMTDYKDVLYAGDGHTEPLNAMDFYTSQVSTFVPTRKIENHITIAYALRQLKSDMWIAETSKQSMLAINASLSTQYVKAPYCADVWSPADCIHLPRLTIQRVGVNMLAVTSIRTRESHDEFVTGILWRSSKQNKNDTLHSDESVIESEAL